MNEARRGDRAGLLVMPPSRAHSGSGGCRISVHCFGNHLYTMYTPAHFAETDRARIEAVIRDNAFGTLVSVVDGRAQASHIPFLYDSERGVLQGHVARANPQWETLDSAQDVLVIFQGPHAYISPTWYTRPGVPTWNYVTVHVHGRATTFEEPGRLRALVEALSSRYEAPGDAAWSGEYNPRMLGMIVGFEIAIDDIQAKFKLSQNRSVEDRRAVVDALRSTGDPERERLAALMEQNQG